MIKKKSYLGAGIVLGVIALAISMMCIAFSYADVNGATENESVDNAATNDAWTIKLDPQGISAEKFSKYCSFDVQIAGECATWDASSNTILLNQASTKYSFMYWEPVVRLMVSIGGDVATNIIGVDVPDSTKVKFLGWGTIPGGDLTENSTLYPQFQDLDPDYDSAVISGKVWDATSGIGIANAPLCLADKKSGYIYLSTTTNSNGEYTFYDVKPELIKDMENNPFIIYGSYPGYWIGTTSLPSSTPGRIENNIAYFEQVNMGWGPAEINVTGADHHKIFDLEITIHKPSGDEKEIYHLPYFGLSNSYLSKGGEFVIDEGGLIVGSAETVISGSTIKVDVECQVNCDSGYKFDYFELNDTKYKTGDTFTLDGVSDYTGVVNYTSVEQVPQTRDVIPFAVLIGLGLVAIAAFAVARKQYNR